MPQVSYLDKIATSCVNRRGIEEPTARQSAIHSFKITTFNVATASLIASVALAIISNFNPIALAASVVMLAARLYVSTTIKREERDTTPFSKAKFVFFKQLLPQQAVVSTPSTDALAGSSDAAPGSESSTPPRTTSNADESGAGSEPEVVSAPPSPPLGLAEAAAPGRSPAVKHPVVPAVAMDRNLRPIPQPKPAASAQASSSDGVVRTEEPESGLVTETPVRSPQAPAADSGDALASPATTGFLARLLG